MTVTGIDMRLTASMPSLSTFGQQVGNDVDDVIGVRHFTTLSLHWPACKLAVGIPAALCVYTRPT
jgi:hypothetical protein